MTNITSNTKFVKRKIKRWDINPAAAQKNAAGGVLKPLKGEITPRGSRKSTFLPGMRILDPSLLDTSEISPQRKG